MDNEHEELEEAFGSEDATLRMALAEAEMEISLLKIELMRTRQRLEKAEAALATRDQARALDSLPPHSEVLQRTHRTSAPPAVRPKETVCSPSHFPSLSAEGSAGLKNGSDPNR